MIPRWAMIQKQIISGTILPMTPALALENKYISFQNKLIIIYINFLHDKIK